MNLLPASQIAKEYGFTARHWTRLAAAGKLPGTYQPSGEGGKWLFDAQVFGKWFKQNNRREHGRNLQARGHLLGARPKKR
jgi:hypothetical protein